MKYALSSDEFKDVYHNSHSLLTHGLLFKYTYNQSPKLGFIVSRKYGNSVNRNLFKRRCRYGFYQLIKHGFNYSVIIQPKDNNISWTTINKSFETLYEKITD